MPDNQRILIINNDPIEQNILRLDLATYDTVLAENSQEALELLKDDDHFDAIILKQSAKKSDSKKFISELKTDEKLAHIPVIMQIEAISNQDIMNGINAGTPYYLITPYDKSAMLLLLKGAIQNGLNKKMLLSKKHSNHNFVMIDSCKFDFKTLEDVSTLSWLVAKLCPQPDKVALGISELMLNAIEHGNLEIDFSEKSNLILNNCWLEEIDKRINSDKFKNRRAFMRFKKNNDYIEITIEDEGKGFDYKSFLTPSLSHATLPNGRGIVTAKFFSFDSIKYSGKGNKVIAKIMLNS